MCWQRRLSARLALAPVLVLALTACGDPTQVQVDVDPAVGTAVDASGGTVTSDDGSLQLLIPAGALQQTTRITITPVEPTELGEAFSDVAVDQAFELSPDGLVFDTPITVSLATAPLTLDSTGAVEHRPVQLLTSRNGALEPLGEVTVSADLTAGTSTVTGTLDHFSPLVLTRGNPDVTIRVAFPGPAGPDGVYETRSGETNTLNVVVTGPPDAVDTSFPDAGPGDDGFNILADAQGSVGVYFDAGTTRFRAIDDGLPFEVGFLGGLAFSRGISALPVNYACPSSGSPINTSYLASIRGQIRRSASQAPISLGFELLQQVRCLPSLFDVVVDPNPVTVAVGDEVSVVLAVTDRSNGSRITDGLTAAWSLEGDTVAQIVGPSVGPRAISIAGIQAGTDTLVVRTNVPVEGDDSRLHELIIPVTVVEPQLTGVVVLPSELTVPNGRTASVRVFGEFDVGPDREVTGDAAFTTAAPAIASAGPGGLVSGNQEGGTTMSARVGDFTATIPVTVGPPAIDAYRIEPDGDTFGLNQVETFLLIAERSDGTEDDLTASADWAFDTTVNGQIEVSNAPGQKGIGRATRVGRAIVEAIPPDGTVVSAEATVVGPESLFIRDAERQPLTPPLSVSLGTPSVQLRLIGAFASEFQLPEDDFTELADWDFESDDASVVANVSDDPGSKGILSPVNVGTGTAAASLDRVGTATLAVEVVAAAATDTLFDELFVSNNQQISYITRDGNGGFRIVLEPDFAPAPNFTPQGSPAVQLGFSASAPPTGDVTESCVTTEAGSYCTGLLNRAGPEDPLPSLPTLPALATTGAGSASFEQAGDAATQVNNVTDRGPLYDPISDTLGLSISDNSGLVDEISVPIGADPFTGGASIIRTPDGLDTVLFLPQDFATLRVFVFLADNSVLVIEPEAGAGTPVGGGTELPLAPGPIQDMIADAGGVRTDGGRQIIVTVGRSDDLDGAVPDDPDRTVPGGGGYALPIPREQLDPPAEACPNRPSEVRCVAGPDDVRLVTNRNGQVGMFDPVNGEFLGFFLGGSAPNFIVDDGWEMTQGPDNCLVVADDDNGVWLYDTDASRIVTDGLGNTLNTGSTQPLIDDVNVRGLAFGQSADGTVNHLYLSVRADFDDDGFPDDGSRIIRYDYAVTGDAVLSNRTVVIEVSGAEFNDVLVVGDRIYVGDQAPESADVAQDLVRIYGLDGADLGLLVDDSVTPYQIVPLLDGRIGLAEFGRVRNRIVTPDGETVGVYPTSIGDPGSDRPRGFFPLLGGNYLTSGESEIGVSVQDRFNASLLQQDTGSERFIGKACVFR